MDKCREAKLQGLILNHDFGGYGCFPRRCVTPHYLYESHSAAVTHINLAITSRAPQWVLSSPPSSLRLRAKGESSPLQLSVAHLFKFLMLDRYIEKACSWVFLPTLESVVESLRCNQTGLASVGHLFLSRSIPKGNSLPTFERGLSSNTKGFPTSMSMLVVTKVDLNPADVQPRSTKSRILYSRRERESFPEPRVLSLESVYVNPF